MTTFCPACGADIERLTARDYTDKLIGALTHFEPETVVRAAEVLARRRARAGLGPIVDAVRRHWRDPYVCAALVRSVATFDDPRADALVHEAKTHPSLIVRRAASAPGRRAGGT